MIHKKASQPDIQFLDSTLMLLYMPTVTVKLHKLCRTAVFRYDRPPSLRNGQRGGNNCDCRGACYFNSKLVRALEGCHCVPNLTHGNRVIVIFWILRYSWSPAIEFQSLEKQEKQEEVSSSILPILNPSEIPVSESCPDFVN